MGGNEVPQASRNEEAWQHLQGGGAGEEKRKGAAEELSRVEGCGRQAELGVQGICG